MDGLSIHIPVRLFPTRQLVLLFVLSALCVGIQLTPRPPNIEFTSLVVFLVGALFGSSFGATLGILVMLINGFFSPWGFAGLMMPFQITGMGLVGIGGGIYKRARSGCYDSRSMIETAIVGAFLTLIYDIITNFGVALAHMLVGTPILISFVSAIISGAIFSLLHISSNIFVFGLTFFPLTRILQNLQGGGKNWREDSSLT